MYWLIVEINTEIGKDFLVCLLFVKTISFFGDLRSQEPKPPTFSTPRCLFQLMRKMRCNPCQASCAAVNELNPLRRG